MLSMVTMATAAALLILYPGGAAQEDWCDPGWNTFTTTCFKLFTEPKSWSAAQTYCEEMDGNLLSVNATPGLERVTKEMSHKKQSSWWTGWHKRIENETVIDLDARISFLNQLWGKGEPNYRHKEDCAEITINGTLNDAQCNRNNNFICVKFSTSGQESTQTIEDCGPGWFLMHRACYKLSTDALPWESAKKNCEVDGGYLLSVSSVAEMNLDKEGDEKRQQTKYLVGRATEGSTIQQNRGCGLIQVHLFQRESQDGVLRSRTMRTDERTVWRSPRTAPSATRTARKFGLLYAKDMK
ncbi:C-type lectin lectoxin-Lio3-like [Pomacea canaliculata]|uniref:C-type lectin lectoxin-Lio3-like n=1 Tax=Pomacea canaliculata TaxID=400727 RepID=UPI000D72B10F|nr:C-type lectin lectoxin-Lio3-like [Pomacea canaliculata]